MAKLSKFILLFLGLALFGAVVLEADFNELWIEVSRVGVKGTAIVMLVYAFYFAADAFSWQLTLPSVACNLRWIGRMFLVRMVGEAYNNITPTASMGGEPVKAWLLKSNWNVPLRDSGASLVIAKTTSMFSLVLFTAIGVFMLFKHPQLDSGHRAIALSGLVFLILAVVIFFLMQRLKLSTFLGRKLEKLSFGSQLTKVARATEDIDFQFASFYSQHRSRLFWSFVFAMSNWVLGVVEVYLILNFIGHPVSFEEAWMIECMVQLVRTITFFIPAGLGTQEGAFLIAVDALTGSPSAGIATALVRRFRDILWIGLSLFIGMFYTITPGQRSLKTPPS